MVMDAIPDFATVDWHTSRGGNAKSDLILTDIHDIDRHSTSGQDDLLPDPPSKYKHVEILSTRLGSMQPMPMPMSQFARILAGWRSELVILHASRTLVDSHFFLVMRSSLGSLPFIAIGVPSGRKTSRALKIGLAKALSTSARLIIPVFSR
jgi:hypothetical protein